jgi:hypothetical protein
MTEATALAAFMQKLRAQLQDAVVMKHADLGLKGMPDCSITYQGLTLWLEAKLLDALREHTCFPGHDCLPKAIQKRVAGSPVQLNVCRRLARAGHCLYLIWFRKAGLVFWDPLTEEIVGACESTAQAVEWVEKYLWTIGGSCTCPCHHNLDGDGLCEECCDGRPR